MGLVGYSGGFTRAAFCLFNMENISILIKEFGFPVATATVLVGTFIHLSRLLISHFIEQMNEATKERKEITINFSATVNEYIQRNSEILLGLCEGIKEAREEHKEMLQVFSHVLKRARGEAA